MQSQCWRHFFPDLMNRAPEAWRAEFGPPLRRQKDGAVLLLQGRRLDFSRGQGGQRTPSLYLPTSATVGHLAEILQLLFSDSIRVNRAAGSQNKNPLPQLRGRGPG